MVALVGLGSAASAFAANTYYVSKSAGSDTNTSTQAKSKGTPWAHIPGMASATSNLAAYTPIAGDTFILMGCDVWVSSDLPVSWKWSGSSGSPITITVDKTWYNTANCPSTWNRPIFNNASHTAYSPNALFNAASGGATSWIVFDNVELKGLACTGACSGLQVAIWCYNSCSNSTFSNNYLHAWNIATDGNCMLFGLGASSVSDTFTQNIIDGSDATGASPAGATCYAIYTDLPDVISNNVIHDLANGIVGASGASGSTVISGNLIYNIKESNAGSHPNAIEFVGGGTYYVYSNVIHDSLGESLMFGNTREVDYVWNNLWYNILGNTPEGPQDSNETGITSSFWNNTIVLSSAGTCIQYSGQPGGSFNSITIENNHCISTGSVASSSFSGTSPILNNNVLMSPATAASQGYTSSETYAYSPTASTSGTVGKGKTICGLEKTCTGSFAALASDTNYACSQQTVNGVVQAVCPARPVVARQGGVGAYEYASGGSAPTAPTGLTAVVH